MSAFSSCFADKKCRPVAKQPSELAKFPHQKLVAATLDQQAEYDNTENHGLHAPPVG
jgi:hypothetical protein